MKNRKSPISRQNRPKFLKKSRREETFWTNPTPPRPTTATTVTRPRPSPRAPRQLPEEVRQPHQRPRPRRHQRQRRGPQRGQDQDQRPLVRKSNLPSPSRPRRARGSTRSSRTPTSTPTASTRPLLKRRITQIRPDSEKWIRLLKN